MKTRESLTAVMLALMALGVAQAQMPANTPVANILPQPSIVGNVPNGIAAMPTGIPHGAPIANGTFAETGSNAAPHAGAAAPGGGPPVYGPGLSDWIAYPRPCHCCGPVGGCGPIASEVYGRAGFTLLTGGGLVGDNGELGFTIGAGMRTLYYNKPDAAWVLDLGLQSTWHDIMNSPQVQLRDVTILIPGANNVNRRQQDVIVIASSVHYLLANFTIGRELYLWGGPTCGNESKFRVGWDVGGIWGSSKMIAAPTNLATGEQLRSRQDVVGGFKAAIHGDYECPTGCCTAFIGGRLEYGAIWSDILQSHNDTNTQMVTFLLNFGVRF